ncbi:hypothetical protein ACFYRN_15355 [Streptomyces sp. NPDC005227]|uniref:hypothetical protein n=1 Tax=unclassified Streptomyces TaxID=2593676 RepID=UPI0036C05733
MPPSASRTRPVPTPCGTPSTSRSRWRKLLTGGAEGGLDAGDPSIFSSTSSPASSVGSTVATGGRNYLAADLDGDGVTEVMSLNSDDYGMDCIAENLGGRYLSADNGIHQVGTYKLS